MPRKRSGVAGEQDDSQKSAKNARLKRNAVADSTAAAGAAAATTNAAGDAAGTPAVGSQSSEAASVGTASGCIADRFLAELVAPFNRDVQGMSFGKPVEYVYNPLEYASEPHADYIRKYCNSTKHILFLGMNPGPFGMAQNGVPFGEHDSVVNFLGIQGQVGKPAREHPKRPIVGLDFRRKEVSGSRFWGLWRSLCGTPAAFFRHAFVHNHCGLVFMTETGKNVTPADLRVEERRELMALCDAFVCRMVRLLGVRVVVGVGRFAEDRARKALAEGGVEGVRVTTIMHPSPINPAANRGWQEAVTKQLEQLDLLRYFQEEA